jgi:hypothetical protein
VLLEAAIHDEGDGLILCDKVMTALILVTLCFFFFDRTDIIVAFKV